MAINSQPENKDFLPEPTETLQSYQRRRVRTGLVITVLGYLVFLIGTSPGLFGLDRSPVIGFIQIAMFLVGLGIICIGGYISFISLWKDRPRSIAADFGLRFVSTGFVMTVFTGMADIFGLGSHLRPNMPFFGEWQATGVMIGEAVIAVGFLLLIPWQRASDRLK